MPAGAMLFHSRKVRLAAFDARGKDVAEKSKVVDAAMMEMEMTKWIEHYDPYSDMVRRAASRLCCRVLRVVEIPRCVVECS
jgi:hypothetical protein